MPLWKTSEQKQWLLDNFKYCKNDIKKLTNCFNLMFECECESKDIRHFLYYKGIVSKRTFTDSQKDFLISNRKLSSFALQKAYNEEFDENVSDTWIRRKLFDLGISKEYKKFVWERQNGKIPKGYTIINLNNDDSDNSIDNLYLVSQKAKKLMKKNNWISCDKNLTMVAIKYCELYYKLKGSEVV